MTNPYVQAYALKAMRDRRTDRGVQVALSSPGGRLRLRDRAEQAGSANRTYVEII